MALTARTIRQAGLTALIIVLPAMQTSFAQPPPTAVVAYEGPLELTEAERGWLAEHPQLRLGVDPAWAPFEFLDASGRYRGMAAEYMKLLGNLLGVSLTPVTDLSWPQVIHAARSGELDVLPAVLDTPQRREFLAFTRSYLNFPMVIMTRDDATVIRGIDDLHGSRIGVVEGYASVDILQSGHPKLELVQYKTLDEGLENLSLGRVDAFVENLASIASAIKRTGLSNVKVAARTPYQSSLAIGVRKDWPQLVGILNKALASLRPEQVDGIEKRWIRIEFERTVNLPFIWKAGILVVAAMLLVLVLVFIWNRRLIREVNRRTRAERTLARRNQILERLSADHSLQSVLTHLVRTVENEHPQMLASILLLDPGQQHFATSIAPSLPDFYNEAFSGLTIGEHVGCCGHAAFTGERTVVADIQRHPHWVGFQELIQRTDLRACWSQPIRGANGRILGTFALYWTKPRMPKASELRLIEELSAQAGVAIDHNVGVQTLRKLSLAVEQSPNAVLITARDGAIEYANSRFFSVTGYPAAEVLGKTPRLLQPQDSAQSSQDILWAAIEAGREWSGELQYRRKDGSLYWSRDLVSPIVNTDGAVTHFVWLQEDVTESRRSLEKIAYQATHDTLTGLMNRHEFERRLAQARSEIENSNREHALCFLDLDQFKIINDTMGHAAGDELLRQISLLLDSRIRKRDCLARFGGDEFAILMEDCPIAIAYDKCEQLRQIIESHRFSWGDRVFSLGASIGLAPISANGGSSSDVLRHADIACYAAKEAGRNRTHMFEEDDELTRQRSGEMLWVSRITEALENDGFTLFVQPVVSVGGADTPAMYEVLLRMKDDDGTLLPPGAFLPAAERFNLITRIDRWVVDRVFRWLREHREHIAQDMVFAINLAGPSLGDAELLAHLVRELDKGAISSTSFKFEITETSAIANLAAARKFIETLHAYGVEFALDDFGSGLSSFGYLKNLDVEYLKIDGMFVRDMTTDPINAAMVKSINDIGHVMGKKTIAEFVENKEILAQLAAIGVDFAQGYGLGKPAPMDELLQHHQPKNRAA